MAEPTRVAKLTWFYRPAAEFLLIVVGVLVALFLESWWSSKQDRDLEATYIEELRREAQTHIDSINLTAAVSARKRESLEEAITLLSDVFDPDSARELIQGLLQGSGIPVVAELSSAVFSDLESSGRLNLITNNELRRAVLQYYAGLPAMFQRAERWAAAADSELHAFVSRKIPAGSIAQDGPRLRIVWDRIEEDEIIQIAAEIHAVEEVRGYVNAQARQLEAERTTVEEIIQRLDDYIAFFEEL